MSIFYEGGKVVSEIGTGRIEIKNSSIYKIGDTIDGGRVVYTYGEPITGFKALVAKHVITLTTWGSVSIITQASGTTIESGLQNTTRILAIDSTRPIAASLAYNFSEGWYLPSKDELNEIYKNKTLFGTLTSEYWSSTEYDINGAWVQRFSDGNVYEGSKSSSRILFQVKIILG